jgi:integrase
VAGLRISEARNLQTENVDLKKGVLTIRGSMMRQLRKRLISHGINIYGRSPQINDSVAQNIRFCNSGQKNAVRKHPQPFATTRSQRQQTGCARRNA